MITKKHLLQFIEQCQADRQDPLAILRQLKLYCEGVRDVRLGDNCILLITGESCEGCSPHTECVGETPRYLGIPRKP